MCVSVGSHLILLEEVSRADKVSKKLFFDLKMIKKVQIHVKEKPFFCCVTKG